jgi:hypothetical protein
MNTKILRSDKAKSGKTNKPTVSGLFLENCCPVRESKFQKDVFNIHDMQVGEAIAVMPEDREGLRAQCDLS